MQLQETGYKFGSDQRLGIYLTNTLEEAARKSEHLFADWVSEEANAAAEDQTRQADHGRAGQSALLGHLGQPRRVDSPPRCTTIARWTASRWARRR